MSKWLRRNGMTINALMVVSVVFVVAWTLWSGTAEWFERGTETGQALYDASLAYASAWLFQWLVIVRPERRRQADLHVVVAPRIDRLIELGIELSSILLRLAGKAPGFPIEASTIERVLSKTSPGDEAPGWMSTTWPEVLEDLASSSAVYRDGLKPFYSSLDHQVVARLELEEGHMQVLVRTARASQVAGWADMAKLVAPMADWIGAVESLRQERLAEIAPHLAVPVPDAERFEHFKVPIGKLGELRRANDELREFLANVNQSD